MVSDAKRAIGFYEKVFGAKLKSLTEMEFDGVRRIVHADLDFGHGYLQLGSANPHYRLVLPPGNGEACYSLGIYVPDVDHTFALAIEHGAQVREQPANFVSGDRYASILDPVGVRWSIMSRVEDLSEEESFRRVDEWSKNLN